MEIKYLIKCGNLFLSNHPSNHHWTEDIDRAKRFDFLLSADAIAIMELSLNIDEYEIVEYRQEIFKLVE